MRRLVYVVTFLLLQAAITAEATTVPITGISQGTSEVYNAGYTYPPGWTPIGTVGTYDVTNPMSYPYTLPVSALPPVGWAAYCLNASGFTQIVPNNYTIQPNTVYTLSVEVGGRELSYVGGYYFDGSDVILSDANTNTSLASTEIPVHPPGDPNIWSVYGTWVLSSATFTTGSSGGPIGDQLELGLFSLNGDGAQTFFYDVQLDASPSVPEPATLIIWSLLGGLGITIGRRCKRKAA